MSGSISIYVHFDLVAQLHGLRRGILRACGLLLGTIIGVAFLGGIPVGLLIAAGILSLIAGKV